MGTPLIIDTSVKEDIRNLCDCAKAQPVDMPALMERMKTPEGMLEHRAQMTRQTISVPLAFLVTFSIEHGHPCGACRHMSMSVEREGRLPTPFAVWLIAVEFGFVGALEKCSVWQEKLRGHGHAINVVQPLDYQP